MTPTPTPISDILLISIEKSGPDLVLTTTLFIVTFLIVVILIMRRGQSTL